MNPVQQKIPCVYEIGVMDEVSQKRKQQPYKVTATGCLHAKAQADNIALAKPTEKLDGTCCLIQIFEGKPWLWARHDRKPNKAGEKRYAQYKRNVNNMSEQSSFSWNQEKDFKKLKTGTKKLRFYRKEDVKKCRDVPPNWVPANRLKVVDGIVLPDKLGHTPGWVPVELKSRQHCWHLSAVCLESGQALILRESGADSGKLVLRSEPLSNLVGQTCELIGTNVNGNPYGIGTKKAPLHLLVPHGCLSVTSPSPVDFESLAAWLAGDTSESAVEGIVWHCNNGELYKLHRHHLNLTWPVAEPRLSQQSVRVEIEPTAITRRHEGNNQYNLFSILFSLNGQVCDSLSQLHSNMYHQELAPEDP